MAEKHKYPKLFWVSIGIFSFICVVIFSFPAIFTQCGSIVDFTGTGEIGDTIGGLMGPFVAIGAAFLTFMAFWVQKEANDAQRRDIKVERFNNNFFNLLTLHEQITDALELGTYVTESGESKFVVCKGRSVFYHAYKDAFEDDADVSFMGEGMQGRLKAQGLESYTESELPTYFDHYFRNMYRVVKYVDETDVFDDLPEKERQDKKYEYVAILRSTLSRYEMVWLFYNSLSVYGKDNFKPLVEKYAMLNNLRADLLVDSQHVKQYKAKAFGGKYPA